MLHKIKREIVVALSQIGLKKVTSTYMGMKLRSPTLYGMVNGGFIVPAEYWMSDCLRAFIKTKAGCVLDIGANVGVYLVKLRVISGDVAYYGVEPNHACNFYTQELIRLNNFRNARVLPFAVADYQGLGMIYAGGRGDKGGSPLRSHRSEDSLGHSFETFFVRGDFLVDALGLQEIAVIKIDVEEGELAVLRGLAQTITRYRPYIYCEILESSDDAARLTRTRAITAMMQELEYQILGVEKESRALIVIREFERIGRDFQQDYVLAPAECVDAFQRSIAHNQSGVTVDKTDWR